MAKNTQFKATTQTQLDKEIEKNQVTFGNPAYSRKTGEEFKVTLSGVIEVREFKNEQTGVVSHPAYALSKTPKGFAIRLQNGVKLEDIKDGAEREVIIMENEINGRMVKYASFND